MKIYRVAVCDDNEATVEIIDEIIKKLFSKYGIMVQIDSFGSAEALWQKLKITRFDLLFLDIVLPREDGIALGEQLRKTKHGRTTDIIYVSGCEQRVFDALKVRPFGFVRKSNFLGDITDVIRNYLETFAVKDEPTITVEDKSGVRTVKCSDAVYFEGSGKVQMLHVSGEDEPVQIHRTLGKIEEELSQLGFIRIHKGILVNFRYISRILANDVELIGGELLPMSRRKSAEIKSRYLALIKNLGNVLL